MAEKAVEEAATTWKTSVTAIVMETKTGEVISNGDHAGLQS